MASALISFGSNLGDRQRILDDAVALLAAHPEIRVVAKSRWHATRPIGGPPGQGEFLNGAALLETTLLPEQLHEALKQIESAAGRIPSERWGPRILDLDLLLYDSVVIDTPQLVLPHPRMAFRRFVLEPAARIAPAMKHPTIGWTLAALRDHLRGDHTLRQFGSRYVAAIAGPVAAGKTRLAAIVAAATDVRTIADPVAQRPPRESVLCRGDSQLSQQIELATARRRQISRPSLMRIEGGAISDYWLEQSYCDAESVLPPEELAQYAEECSAVFEKAIKPQLLVLLDVSPDVSWLQIANRGEPIPNWITHDWLVRYRELLMERVTAPKRGPLLRLDGNKPDEARDELVAAIQAMQ